MIPRNLKAAKSCFHQATDITAEGIINDNAESNNDN